MCRFPSNFPLDTNAYILQFFVCVSWTSLVQFNKWEVHGMRLTQISWNRFHYSLILASWIESILLIIVAELARQPLPQEKDPISLLVKYHRKTTHLQRMMLSVQARLGRKGACTLESVLFSVLTLILGIFYIQFIMKLLLIFKRNEDSSIFRQVYPWEFNLKQSHYEYSGIKDLL